MRVRKVKGTDSRPLGADVPVSSPGPAGRGFETLFGQFNSPSDVAILGVG